MLALPSSSSSLTRKRKREFTNSIFLSFHGKDTRKKFTAHLYKALEKRGIKAFKDDINLERGEYFAMELLKAIGESWGSIIVISKRYAFSSWCLNELVEIMKQRKDKGHRVYPIFYKVEPSDFRHQLNKVKEAFDKHEKRHKEETRQRWRDALKEVADIHGWSLKKEYDESIFIDDIVKDISKELDAQILDEQEFETMKSTLRTIQALLVDTENKQYMKEGKAVKVWLDNLKHIAYDMDDVLDKWNTAILQSKINEKGQGQIPSTPSSSLSEVCNIPLRIKELNEKYQAIVKQKDVFSFALDPNNSKIDLTLERPKTISLIDESNVYGRDHDKDALIRSLLSGGNGKGISLLAIVGMGGLGKTTLAQLTYNDDKVKKHFHQRIWVCVSHPFDDIRIAKAILETLKGIPSMFNELESLLREIHQNIEGKRFLLILDDVWIEEQKKLEPLKLSLSVGCQESKILVTTRNEKVASILGCTRPFKLQGLSEEDCWCLFSKIAFSERSKEDCENLESIGRKCVEKCAGLPLAVKTLASLLFFKRTREQWQRILDSHIWELDEAEEGLFCPLLLSYYDLPSPLRQCFSYCAIFPKNHVIEKDKLIKLWMAQGFSGATQGKKMEIVCEEYFDNLVARSFFQEFKKVEDDDSIIIGCKMHDIVHDFARLLRKTECCLIESHEIYEQGAEFYHENVRHLTLIIDNYSHIRIPDPTYDVRKLRSLLLVDRSSHVVSTVQASLPKLFDLLTCLRMLDLSSQLKGIGTLNLCGSSIKDLPEEIGKLIYLRYLSLEGNVELYELPDALCDLCNLQTLNIRRCPYLQKLPCGMEKLVNLRHLQNALTGITFMPKGMQRLTCLQTLDLFVVEKGGGIESETPFSLADLANLIHLRGHLRIVGLGNVGDASEAGEAQLSTKDGLCELTLHFDGRYDNERQTVIEDEASVLQALRPPPHLQSLRICYCRGPAFPFPNWMASLTSLKLGWCYNWESLPPMGKLQSLESLSIYGMKKVKKVGAEFLGVETSSSSVNHIIAFPNLKTLDFHAMDEWEEWEYEEVLRSRGGDDFSSSNMIIMPKLQRLVIFDCPVLKMLPHNLLQCRALQEIEIFRSPILSEHVNMETRDDWSSISHIPALQMSSYEGIEVGDYEESD